MNLYDLVIIGGGPAGLAAGIYAGRANLNTVLLEKGLAGGQMQNTLEVENYPGISEITGPELSGLMEKHMIKFGAEIKQTEVTGVKLHKEIKEINTKQGIYKGKAVIIASGAQPRYLNVPGEKEFSGRGVSYCATCDGAFFKGKHVTVVGGGDSALEEGLFLTRFAESVTIIHRRDSLRAQPILQERAFANEKISFIWDSTVSEILGENVISGVKIHNFKTNEEKIMPTEGVFIYIGFLPNTNYLKGSEILNEAGYVVANRDMKTQIPGVFATGDVRNTNLRQIVTATSDGAVAAMAAYHYLENQ